jgi:hypothetical protein
MQIVVWPYQIRRLFEGGFRDNAPLRHAAALTRRPFDPSFGVAVRFRIAAARKVA